MSPSLEGIWQPLYAEHDGEEAPKMVLDKMELELAAGKYTIRFGGEAVDSGTYTTTANELTFVALTGANAGRTIPCLFKFAGGALSICYGIGGQRPDKFSTAQGQQRYLANYHRKA
jgi:uncharacterized protein (TIGR03067 family)